VRSRRRIAAAPTTNAAANRVNASIAPPPPEPPEDPLAEAVIDAAEIVSCAVPERAESAADTAVTVTVAGEGTVAGAVYNPEVEIVPAVVLPPVMPLTCQVTAMFVELATVADIIWDEETVTVAPPGLTATVITGATVTCAEALLVVSAAETAVTVTVAGEGTAAGAVYTPPAEIVPTVALPPSTPLTCHVTVEFKVLPTVAVKGRVPPFASTLALVGLTATVTGFGQPNVFVAFAGADEVAAACETTTSAVS
jgi:hypothetical protein